MDEALLEKHKSNFYTLEKQDILDSLVNEVKKSPYLPELHIFPKAGHINDPNGLAYFNGKYYVFFQWYPFAPVHGLKHWGETSSEDLVHWSEQEVALIPDQPFEKDGCYSGNAIEHDDKLYLFYTANYKTAEGKIPKQALAVMDKDKKITKLSKPLIEEGIPGLSGELRDPFVFERGGSFYMLLGGSEFKGEAHPSFGEKGVLILYKSTNLLDWDYQGLVDIDIDTGYMLECPSLIEIDGKDVLFLSPMGLAQEDSRFKNRFSTIYLIGHLNIEEMRFEVEQLEEMDAGFDFYAPQAFSGKDKEPLFLAWFGCGEPEYPVEEEWKHGLSLPQELSIEEGQLKRFPAKAVVKYFNEEKSVNGKEIPLERKTYHLELTKGFHFQIGTTDDYWEFRYDSAEKTVEISRAGLKKKVDSEYGFTRSTKINTLDKVDIFVDNSFIEIYLNGGEKVFSFMVFQQNAGSVRALEGELVGTLHQHIEKS